MKVEWWIEDGYVNHGPNYTVEIPDDELERMRQMQVKKRGEAVSFAEAAATSVHGG